MPLNGFLGPSSETAVLTRILHHPVLWQLQKGLHLNQVPDYYYNIYALSLKELLEFDLYAN